MSRLERFRQAQNSEHAGFAAALAELRSGGKQGHWIWYVFPQIEGLGTSGMTQAFALDEHEAAEYLRDPELRSRLLTITDVVADQLRSGRVSSLPSLMGSEIDARKIVSSMTLFAHVARRLHDVEGLDAYAAVADVADDVLAIAAAQGYPRCAHTLARLRQAP